MRGDPAPRGTVLCGEAPARPVVHAPRETLRSPGIHTVAGKPGTHISVTGVGPRPRALTGVRQSRRGTRSQSYLGDPPAGGSWRSVLRAAVGPLQHLRGWRPRGKRGLPPKRGPSCAFVRGSQRRPHFGWTRPPPGGGRPERAGVCRPSPQARRCSLGPPARSTARTSTAHRPPSRDRNCALAGVGPRPPERPAAERRAPAH